MLIYDFDVISFFVISIVFALKEHGNTRIRFSKGGVGIHICTKANLWRYECFNRAKVRFLNQNEITFEQIGDKVASDWLNIETFLRWNLQLLLKLVKKMKIMKGNVVK